MDEFIREVDEEYRRDRITRFWQRYSALIVGLIVVVLIGVAGWRYWENRERTQAEAAATRLYEAQRAAEDGRTDEALTALRAVATEAPGGVRVLARLDLASELGRTDPEAGAKAYDEIAGDAGVTAVLQDLARLRAAMLRLDTTPDQAIPALERLAVPANPFRHTARELLGVAALRRGDPESASRWFDQIAADRETPQGLRGRLEIYSALAAGGPVAVAQ